MLGQKLGYKVSNRQENCVSEETVRRTNYLENEALKY